MRDRTIPLTLCPAVVVAVVIGLATPAIAQEATPPPVPAASEPPPVAQHLAASGHSHGLGIGAAAFLSGLTGPEVTYDFGAFHLAGLVAFNRANNGPMGATESQIQFGVSGWFHLHMGSSSDFSLGSGVGYAHDTRNNGMSAIALEPGVLVRAFVTPNVAVHAGVAVVVGLDNATPIQKHLALAGQILTGFGFTYFFGR
jgi:hypothetical protein